MTNWKYVKTDYTSTTSPAQNIASSETEIAAITNTKVTNLMITKSVDTASGDGNGVTFTYVVTLTTPTGITRDQLKTILGDGWTNVENSSTDVYNSFTITPVTNNAGSYSTSVPNIPYGTKYTVTESELSGWLNIAKSGDTGTISSTASTAIFTNAQKNDLTLTKTLATGTPNTETGKMFLYEVTLEAPTGMEFTKTSGTGTALKLYVKNSTNGVEQEIEINPQTLSYSGGFTNEKFYGDNIDIGTASDSRRTATFKLHLSSNLADGRKIKNLPYGTDYTVTEDTTEFPAVPSTGTSWKQLSADPSGTINASASTANIKNGLVGSLTITKTVSGSAPKTAKTYPFVVELSRDDTLDPRKSTFFKRKLKVCRSEHR